MGWESFGVVPDLTLKDPSFKVKSRIAKLKSAYKLAYYWS